MAGADGFISAWREERSVRGLVSGWLLLALVALGASTACALLLVAARAPLPGGMFASPQLFRGVLVLHVGLAVLVWFLSCAAAYWNVAAGGKAGRLRWFALALATAGVAAMLAASLSGDISPVLANYVPVLDNRMFLAGLLGFLSGVALSGWLSSGPLLARLSNGAPAVWRIAAALSLAAFVLAACAMVASVAALGIPNESGGFELLAWGPGHMLQFVHVLLLMAVWLVLAEQSLGEPVAPRTWVIALLFAAALPLLAAAFIYLAYPVAGTEFRLAFTKLMAIGSWPAAVTLACIILARLRTADREKRRASLPLILSIALFFTGCAIGALIRSETTMVPAHYHGTVGAVTLAYMTLGYRLLAARKAGALLAQAIRWQPLVYGCGLLILAGALAWSGSLGVPRKTLHVDVIAQYPAYFLAMGLAGIGGFLAVSGAAMFVANMFALLRPALRMPASPPVAFALRPALLTLLCAAIGMGGLWAAVPERGTAALVHALQRSAKEEVAQHFAKGASLLSAKQYQAAAAEFHRVLELAPRLPEAHVNMGFAMIGLDRYDMARDFFNVAIDLRPGQTNAYYGLAMALEGTHDLAGALGAMRSYVHLSKKDDAFLAKANAAIWEWEDQLNKSRQASSERIAAIPENGNNPAPYPIREKKLN